MYVIHKSNNSIEEYETNEDLLHIKERKLKKLVTQIKTQRILDPKLDIEKIINRVRRFTKGDYAAKAGNLFFEIKADDRTFYILKIFSSKDSPYTTLRYYSDVKDEAYEGYRKYI